VTIDATGYRFRGITTTSSPPPTEETDEATTFFVAYDEPPEPMWRILRRFRMKVVYPEIARKAGIEGQVYDLCSYQRKGQCY